MGMADGWMPIAGAKDADKFDISTVPVMVLGAAGDCVEPPQSAWKNFLLISNPTKIFMDMAGVNHMTIANQPPTWELVARWSRAHILGDTTAEASLYKPHQLQKELSFSLGQSAGKQNFQVGVGVGIKGKT